MFKRVSILLDEKGKMEDKMIYNGVVGYDARYLANSFVDEEDKVTLDWDDVKGFLEEEDESKKILLSKLKRYVEYKEDGEDITYYQKDDEGFRRYEKKLKFDEKALAEIKEANNDLLRLKKVWLWEKNEHIENSEYVEELAMLEQYFSRFLQDKNEEEKRMLYPDGWASLIEKVSVTESVTITGKDTFDIIGEADIVTRDTLYFVTTKDYNILWMTIYLNILNLIYKKPLLTVLRFTSNGCLYEQNIYYINEIEEWELIKANAKHGGKIKFEEQIKMPRFDRSDEGFIFAYIDDVIEGLEGFFKNETIPFIKKLLTGCTLEFTKESFCDLMLKIIEECIEIQNGIEEDRWHSIMKNVINDDDFLSISTIFSPDCIQWMVPLSKIFIHLSKRFDNITFQIPILSKNNADEYVKEV